MAAAAFCGTAVNAQPLDAVVSASLPTHPRVQAARATARAAGFDIKQAEAAWSPRLGLVADPGVSSRKSTTTGSAAAGDLAVRGTQLIYDGGKSDSETARQKARNAAAVHRINATTELVAGQVADLYLEALKQQRLSEEAAKNVQAHSELVSRVADIVSVDRGRKADLDQATARLEQARVTEATRKAALAEALAQLRATTQRPVSALSPARPAAPAIPASEQAALSGLDQHPSVLASQGDVEAARQQAAIADAWRKPRLDLQGTLGGETAITGNRRYFNTFDVRVVSNWTGFDGGAAEAGAQSAREQMQAALDTLDVTKRDLGIEVSRSWAAIATRQERIAVWDKLVTQLTAVRDNYWEQFKIGRRSILDLLNVENEIFQARTSSQTDLAEQEQARYRLLAATARLSEFFNLPVATLK
jgi:TolC family type I secretion outer membrane protein